MSHSPTFKRFAARKLLSEGIEPFPAIRKCVDGLKPGEGLVVTAPFLPSPLIEKLRGEGLSLLEAVRQSGHSWAAFQPSWHPGL